MARKFYVENIENSPSLIGEEFNHIVNVMRYKVGDRLNVIDGKGFDYQCEISEITNKQLFFKILDKQKSITEANTYVAVFQALVKGDKFELLTQKLTELGVAKIVPFTSEFCQVKANTTRLDRLEKISIEALKQCGRAKKVEIETVKTFEQMIELLAQYDLVLFAYENSTTNFDSQLLSKFYQKKVAVIVGSEGGFSQKESDKISSLKNSMNISLGNRILRAETACIALTSAVMFSLGEWNK